ISLLKGLKFSSTYGINYIKDDYSDFKPSYELGTKEFSTKNSLSQSFGKRFHWTFNNFISYNRTFSGHRFDGILGIVTERKTEESFTASASKSLSNDKSQRVLDAMSEDRSNSGSATEANYISYVGRLAYSYDRK